MCRLFTRFRTGYSSFGKIGRNIAGKQKPYYEIRFAVLKPKHLTGCFMTGRLFCTARAMWKLSWFLRDFGYDSAGANLENEDPTVLLQSMAPFFKFLPGDQRQAFLHEVTAKAS